MPCSVVRAAALACMLAPLAGCAAGAASARSGQSPTVAAQAATLAQFGSDEAFDDFQREMVRAWNEHARLHPPLGTAYGPGEPPPQGYPPPRGHPVDATDPAGVHAPGLVKAAPDHLLVAAEGRLHAVRIAGGALASAARVDSAGESLLVAGDIVMDVAGAHRGIQVRLFRLGAAGDLSHQSTYQISPRHRQLRDDGSTVLQVDGKLVYYTPIGTWAGDTAGIAPYLPRIRRTHPAGDTAWRPLVEPRLIYRPGGWMRADDRTTLHTLVVCDPAGGGLDCRATIVYAPEGASHHVSPAAVYFSASQRPGPAAGAASASDRRAVYRIPLDGGAPTAVGMRGRVGSEAAYAETADGGLDLFLRGSLLRVPPAAFGDGSDTLPHAAYRPLPAVSSGKLHSRYVGDWLLFGTGPASEMGTLRKGQAFAVRRDGTGQPVALPQPPGQYDGLLAIDEMGPHALVTGESLDSLHYYPVRLGASAEAGEPLARVERWMGDVDAHAVFYHADDADNGTLAVSLSNFGLMSSVLFLRNEGFRLREAGELTASVPPGTACPLCGTYGYALPVFVQGRIFVLLRDELVEGVMENGRIRELRRIRLTAAPATP